MGDFLLNRHRCGRMRLDLARAMVSVVGPVVYGVVVLSPPQLSKASPVMSLKNRETVRRTGARCDIQSFPSSLSTESFVPKDPTRIDRLGIAGRWGRWAWFPVVVL